MHVQSQQRPSLVVMITLSGLFGWAAWKSFALQAAFPIIPYVLGFVALAVGLRAVGLSLWRLNNLLIRRDAMAASEQRGSASWATKKDLKLAGLHDTSGVFLGCDTEGHPLFFE